MNDFERLCAYGVAARLKVLDVHAKDHWDFLEESEKAEERRGLLAVLREMQKSDGPLVSLGLVLDRLIAQAEASESEAAE